MVDSEKVSLTMKSQADNVEYLPQNSAALFLFFLFLLLRPSLHFVSPPEMEHATHCIISHTLWSCFINLLSVGILCCQ